MGEQLMDNISEAAEDRMYQEYLNPGLKFPAWYAMWEEEMEDE